MNAYLSSLVKVPISSLQTGAKLWYKLKERSSEEDLTCGGLR